jgi:hypothetical protein
MVNLRESVGVPLTFEEWAALGYPSPQVVTRYAKDLICSVKGTPNIRYLGPGHYTGLIITLEQWRAAGSPPPERC